jgi:hypothetical protein
MGFHGRVGWVVFKSVRAFWTAAFVGLLDEGLYDTPASLMTQKSSLGLILVFHYLVGIAKSTFILI